MNSRAQMLIARGGLIIELGCGWAPLTSPAATQSLRMVSARDVFQPAATGGDSDSLAPVVSVEGRYILFASTARNLISLSSNAIPLPAIMAPKLNVFLRDRTNQSTVLVSINAGGSGGGNGDSVPVALSTNGQFVLFESSASDLVTGDTNRLSDIYLRDLQNNSTLLVSLNTNGMAGNG